MERLPSVLIVSSDQTFRGKAVQYFLEMGYRVQAAENGLRAIAAILEKSVEAALIQAQLPGLSGFDTAVIVKKIDPKVRIIMLLNDDGETAGEETRQIDFFECFFEPLSFQKINQVLRNSSL